MVLVACLRSLLAIPWLLTHMTFRITTWCLRAVLLPVWWCWNGVLLVLWALLMVPKWTCTAALIIFRVTTTATVETLCIVRCDWRLLLLTMLLGCAAYAFISRQQKAPQYDKVQFDLQDMQSADSKVHVTEVWTCWEPMTQLYDVPVLGDAVKHCFMVFILAEPGQSLWGWKYRHLRVERQDLAPQQQGAGKSEALLNIRFARTAHIALTMDVADEKDCHRVKHKNTVKFKQHFQLGHLLAILKQAHMAKPQYDVQHANCVWFVREVLQTCIRERCVTDDSFEAIERFYGHWRTILSTALEDDGPVRSAASGFLAAALFGGAAAAAGPVALAMLVPTTSLVRHI